MTETKNPWKTLKTTEVYDNSWIHIDEHNVINPSGNPGIYGTIHFKNLACGIIPLDDDDTTWIVGQYRYALNRYSWEIPMGGVAVGTDPLTGAQRELKEETGLTAAQWKKILDVDLSNSVTDETGVVFVAEGLTRGEPEFEETEQIEIRELPFDDLVQMVIDGQITDLLSVAGILKLAAIRSR
jgi:8-oxo-dGTP pyrophosphatase MutT (NUDIX family)